MASAHQPQQQPTPSNPFDGFDTYTSVVAAAPVSAAGSVVSSASTPMVTSNGMHTTHHGTPYQQPVQQQPHPNAYQPQPQLNPFASNNTALVPSATQANPYAGMVNQPPQQFPQQPVMQQQQQPQQMQQQLVHVGSTNSWAVAPVTSQVMNPPAFHAGGQQQLITAPPSDNPFGLFEAPPVPATPQQYLEKQMETLHFNSNTPGKHSVMPNEDEEEGLALIDIELDEEDATNNKGQFDGNNQDNNSTDHESDKRQSKSPRRKDKYADIAPPPPIPPGRENAEFLSRNADTITSPLPRPGLVLHAGYVLSRISFRTVLLRKWKQTFWIQYGPTQLLFFRSYADFGDWLNNPYHSAKAREYLVKLRVDFVSDLKKKSVMGYQVTQIRRKSYGKNVMLHFKLERWMDYGPTIAAAFAARQEEMIQSDYYKNNKGERDDEDYGMNTTNDVSALRKIILGCMRNARDAALVASQERLGSPRQQPEYQGRYAGEKSTRREANTQSELPEKFHTSSQSSKTGLYHQAFAAESSERRKYQGAEQEQHIISQSESNTNTEASREDEAVTPIVDLLG